MPDNLAPAWRYAANMVSEPHLKLKVQQPAIAVKGKLKQQKETIAPPPPPVPAVSPTKGAAQNQLYSLLQHRQSRQPVCDFLAISCSALSASAPAEDSEEETDSDEEEGSKDEEGHTPLASQQSQSRGQQSHRGQVARRSGGGGLVCGGCNVIIGRIVSMMESKRRPSCLRCIVCDELLEHVSSYEHAGRPYCHVDYHEVHLFLSLRVEE